LQRSQSSGFKEEIVSTNPSWLFVVLVLSGSTSLATQLPVVPDASCITGQIVQDFVTTQNFQRGVAEYVALHRSLERELPPVLITQDVGQIDRAVRQLRIRIQATRATARQSDIISPDVARMFRRRIATCLTPEEWKAFFVDRAQDEEGEPLEAPPLHVNMQWPAGVPFDFVPPQLLQSLPALPEELQYRIIGLSLVLWDYHTNLIVDFLPDAFAPTT
jgi:hypothetical protein